MAATTRASFGKLGGRPDRDSGNGGNHIKRPRPIYANATATFYKDHHVAKMGSGAVAVAEAVAEPNQVTNAPATTARYLRRNT